MKAYFTTPIRSLEEAQSFLRQLHADGLLFHLDDAPETIIDSVTQQRTFTDEECVPLRERVAEVFQYDPDPLAFCMSLIEPGWRSLEDES